MVSVLHVVSYYPPDRMGGVGEVVAGVHHGLLAAGHASRVLTSGHSRGDPRVIRIASSPAAFSLLAPGALNALRGVDVVHMHHGEALGLLVAMRIARIDVPVLLTLHVNVGAMIAGMRPYRIAGRTLGEWNMRSAAYATLVMPLRELMDRTARALADSTTFISRSAALDTLGSGPAETAKVIYNGLPIVESSVGAVRPHHELLFVGTNSTRKRAESLPLILASVRRRMPTARLRIVGFAADEAPALMELARRLEVVEAITFEGRHRSEDLPPFYRASGVLLVPSSYEGLPMVILEAFREGLPCIATSVSGHPEVVEDGVNGRLVPPDDVTAMADAALELLTLSPAGRARMADAARARVRTQFDTTRQVMEYVRLYEQLAH